MLFSIPWYAIIFISIPQSYLLIIIASKLFNIEIEPRKILVIALIIGFFTYFIRQMPLMFGVHTVILVLILSILLSFYINIDYWNSLIVVLLGVMVLGVLENISLPIFLKLTASSSSDLAVNPGLNIAAFMPVLFLALILYSILKRFNFVLYDLSSVKDKRSKLVISTILVQIFLIILIDSTIIVNGNYENIVAWVNLVLLIIAVMSIVAIKQLEENTKNHLKLNLLKNHLQQVEGLLNTLQSQKHEFGRHVQALQSLIYLNRDEEAREYIDGIAEEYWHMDEMLYIGHPALTGLINSKRSMAESQGIEFAVAVKCELSQIEIPPWDLCSIVGNLLDNAIEAAFQDKIKPRVAIEFKYENERYVIYVHNNGCKISETNIEKIFDPGYTTKSSDARGYGLYLVKKLLDRYAGDIEVILKRQTTIIVRLAN